MKKITILIICISLLSTGLFPGNVMAKENGYHEGVTEGEKIAERQHSSLAYWLAGTPSAFLLSPLIGGTATIVTAYLTSPSPEHNELRRLEDEGYSNDYIRGFETGYEDTASSKNVIAAWGATGVAFAARLILALSVDDGQTYLDNSYENPLQRQLPILNIGFEF